MRARAQLLPMAAPGAALAVGAVAIALEEPSADRVLNAVLAGVGVVLVWGAAAAIHRRYPERPLGRLLFLLSGLLTLQPLVSSPNPLVFTLTRTSRPAIELLLIWLMLSFPSGRLRGRRERALLLLGALSVLLLWLPAVLFSADIPIPGPHVRCDPACPPNVLLLADRPALARGLLLAFRASGALVLAATATILFDRLRRATPLMRRALAPVLFASIARALTLAAFLAAQGFRQVAMVLTLWAIPLAIGLGLLRGRFYLARALDRLVSGLRARPAMGVLREVMAGAIDDPSLAIAYRLHDPGRWADASGRPLDLPSAAEPARAVTLARDASGQPVAALIHDAALLEEPALVEAVAGSMLLALESQRAELELAASRASTATLVEEERRRIERDLHDGAQQRLIALRMKVGVAARLLESDPDRAAGLIGELGPDLDAAMAELRALSHGIVPPALVERGLSAALAEAVNRAAVRTVAEVEEVGRPGPAIERAVYFCCLEALQNVAKHAGAGATAVLSLRSAGGELRFCVSDQGGSAPAPGSAGGEGLANMRARLAAVGGRLEIERIPGAGFRVSGAVPLGRPA